MDMMMGDDLALSGMMPDRDEVQNLARESIESAVGPSTFTLAKVDTWTSNIVENCLKVRVYIKTSDEVFCFPLVVEHVCEATHTMGILSNEREGERHILALYTMYVRVRGCLWVYICEACIHFAEKLGIYIYKAAVLLKR